MRKSPIRRWPLTLLLPLGVSLGMFVVAVGTAQVGLAIFERREVQALEAKAAFFVNGLAGLVGPRLQEGETAVGELLASPLLSAEILVEETLVLRWRAPDGTPRGVTTGAPPGRDVTRALETVAAGPPGGVVFRHASRDERAVIARAFQIEGTRLEIAAALNVGDVVAEMQSAENWALIVEVLLAGIAALFTFVITRRAVAPLDALALEVGGRSVGRGRRRTGSAEVTRLREAIAARLREEEARKLAIADLGEKERNALLAKLAAGLAHEVRNPLAGLLNAVSTLRRFGDKPNVRGETLDLIERGLRSIERVADAMLSTYRPAYGRMRFSHEDLVDIQLLVGPEARRRQLALDWRVDGMRPIQADADALRQVLLNLLLNACKASGENGRVGLTVIQNERETEFAVSDSGPGMPEDVLAFLEEGRMTTPLMRRKGLGLWMVSRLLDDLDGKVRVESRVGEGTRIVVRVPSPIDADATEDGEPVAPPARERAG